MNERSRIALRHKVGSLGSLLGFHKPPLARDHKRDNVRALRELQRQLQQKRLQLESKASQSAFKLKQFENVPSRLHQTPQRLRCCPGRPGSAAELRSTEEAVSSGLRPRCASATVLSAGATSSWARAPARGLAPPSAPSRSPSLLQRLRSRGLDLAPLSTHGRDGNDPADFECAVEKLSRGGRRWVSAGGNDAPGPSLSWWPATVEVDDGAGADEVDMGVPSGYRLMPEAERLRALEDLKLKLAELDQKYARLPLKIETEGQRRQQHMLQEKICEAENAVNLFAREKVIVEG
eukprot:CAMPEP_0171097306 /NCGR_PEP_ID=MMETSP0766_2-20121228/47468_1 /TAXON_ID=439317 /ORGANISM="Gambierdiscus australes, Strain CAWD 149" /LENGTH=291 /DNA_ID=CAMNT_0011556483 /DNA_START=19 /DNA_END=894 /DNA_ORIENTATION=-